MTQLYGTREGVLLENLLANINGIETVVQEASQRSIINTASVPELSEKLYDYRNSIVHGKNDIKLELNIPKILESDQTDRYWGDTIRVLAEKVIHQFC